MKYEFEGKTEQEAIDKACEALGLDADQFDIEILEVQKSSLFKKGFIKIRVHAHQQMSVKADEVLDEDEADEPISEAFLQDLAPSVEEFLHTMLLKMGYQTDIGVSFPGKNKMLFRITSDNSSMLIGRKGKTLDALQHVTSIFAKRQANRRVRVVVDCENYRIRREENLVRLAYVTADQVTSSRQSILLEPMNPYERRLIHTTLNDIHDIETKSEGDGLYKQIRVSYTGR